MPLFNLVPCIMGPTASGKTALAMQLSHLLPIELISVDSTQVYHELNIGSGKLAESQLNIYPHHLINILSPEQAYSAATFVSQATQLIQDIFARQRIPVLVGGTMLYFKALIQGLHSLPHSDPAVRQQVEAQASEIGWPKLHEKLHAIDPETANRLSPNDKQRIGRALEIYYMTERPMSWHLSQQMQTPDFKFLCLGLVPQETERHVLHDRIQARFDQMLNEGLVEEVQSLCQKYDLHPDLPSMRSVGYRQVWSYLQNNLSYEQMREQSIAGTRQLAKRQLTWMRGWPNLHTLDFQDKHSLIKVYQCIQRASEA